MRKPCCDKEGTNKGAWSKQEDQKLTEYIKAHGEGCWRSLPKAAGLQRCGKSCRLRWINYLRPDIKRGNFGQDEEDLIIKLHALLGNRWSLIAGRLPGRTDNEVKNYWNSHIRKKLIKMGIDPNNHRLNQIQIIQAPNPVLSTNVDSHEQLNPNTALVGISEKSHANACMTSTMKSNPEEDKNMIIERANSEAGSCLDDEASAGWADLNLDLTIAFPSSDELKIKAQSIECKLANKEVEIIGNSVISSPTLILFR